MKRMVTMVIPAILEPTAACVVNSPTLVLQATPRNKFKISLLYDICICFFSPTITSSQAPSYASPKL